MKILMKVVLVAVLVSITSISFADNYYVGEYDETSIRGMSSTDNVRVVVLKNLQKVVYITKHTISEMSSMVGEVEVFINEKYYTTSYPTTEAYYPYYQKDYLQDVVNVEPMWSFHQGDPNHVVVVLDTGIDCTHEDLVSSLWFNPNETANGIDDDGNGVVDDINGAAFYNVGGIITGQVSDISGHGTHVAGIIAGAVNDKGITGVAPNVKILPVRIFTDYGENGIYTSTVDFVMGLDYILGMVNRGVNIKAINMSFATWPGVGGEHPMISELLQSLNNRGVLMFAAAGNQGADIDVEPVYPASYQFSNMVAVGSCGNTKNISEFSNYGNVVKIVAPGEDIYSTLPKDGYGGMSGTSMATPMTVGVAMLLWCEYPDASSLEILNRLIERGEYLTDLSRYCSSSKVIRASNEYVEPTPTPVIYEEPSPTSVPISTPVPNPNTSTASGGGCSIGFSSMLFLLIPMFMLVRR